MNRILTLFLRGLLVLGPLVITVYLLWVSVVWMDNLLPFEIPGLGFLVVVLAVTLTGLLATLFIGKKLLGLFERLIINIPLVNILYSSLKELIGAFLGEKKRFNKPVLVCLNQQDQIYKIGFITDDNLNQIGMDGFISVYLPHSYNFSGNHFLVPEKAVRKLDLSGTEAMKYVISGGVTKLTELSKLN